MSSDDQNAAIARIVTERFEAKKQHALLQNELTVAGKTLGELAQMLQFLGIPNGAPTEQVLGAIQRNSDLLTPSKLAQMLSEYATLEKRIPELNNLANKAGID